MDGSPAKVTIQQLPCGKNNFENIFTFTFQANIKHKRGHLKAKRLIDAKKTEIYSKFQNNLNIKPRNLFKEKLGSLDQHQYGFNNRIGAGKSVSTFQSISSRARRKVFDVHNVFKEIFELKKEYKIADTERNTTIKPSRVNLDFIQQLSLSHSGISTTLFGQPLVGLYHTVAPYCTLQVDATSSIIASMPWLKNADNKPKRILLYALTVKSPSEKGPSSAFVEHITSNHNVFLMEICSVNSVR